MKKNLFVVVIFLLFNLGKTAFLANINLFGLYFNPLVLAVVFVNIFERPERNSGFLAALLTGFFWDLYSQDLFLVRTAALLAISLLIKNLNRKYLHLPYLF